MKISQRIAASRPLATTAMHGRVEAMKLEGREVIDFSIAISHFPAPEPVLRAVREGLSSQRSLPYTAVVGAAGLRDSLLRKLREENRLSARRDEVIVTNGAKQALYEALYVMTDPGDSVIVFRPHWPAYVATAELLGLRPLLVDLPARITPAFLDSLPPARVLIINNPHNPTGKVYGRDELEAIAAWLARRQCHAIVDESYEKLIFSGRHHSLAALCDWRALGIVTIFSASQSYAMMGWRAGFALAPAAVVDAMQTLQGPITAAAPALTQLATQAAFACGDPSDMLADYRTRRDLVVDMFAPVPWIDMPSPDSGPYLWGDVSRLTMDTVGFAEALLERQAVAVMPGDALGVPGFIRIGFISDDVATLRRGAEAIIRFGNEFAGRQPKQG
ncbi:pyridoxal phosphate-dependent aminotransferase [Noviherbaspirillum aridicola]|uniref:Aminotransferase n=1 Tax=Noviherbaspirillum aridicola TaxID=2849687 RepID=A0ABQ4Q511_9BURK|nr:aminotransferase class I/II-fold pyridoxal phosphate-dependent enzyme [Noviherbaspirillum aridicola]GIZ51880.1 aminotransferase [Noviherbaspirillum aridicola]